jgi:hypothetical protein
MNLTRNPPERTAIVNVMSNGWAQVRLSEDGHEWPWVTLESEASALREVAELGLSYTVVRQPTLAEIERANIRAQIAAQQRSIFGGVWCGRREVRHQVRQGVIEVRRVVAFGLDHNDQDWTYAEIAGLLNAGETVVGKKD